MLDPNLLLFLLTLIVVLLGAQVFLMMRMRNIIQSIGMNFHTLLYFARKLTQGNAPATATTARTCQFCKHRLAYINTSKTRADEEDFYFKCALRNVNITLDDSCDRFDPDPDLPK